MGSEIKPDGQVPMAEMEDLLPRVAPNLATTSINPQGASTLPADTRIVLNVGGKRYETTLATLRKYPDSLLGCMFSEEKMVGINKMTKPDQSGEYFLDRNGSYFEPILDFYRTGIVLVPKDMCVLGIKEEINFYQLPVDDRHIHVEKEMWGDRLAKFALARAVDNGRPIFDKIMHHITNALSAAADRGCWKATIDICRTTAYVRTSGGIVKRDGPRVTVSSLASFYPPSNDDSNPIESNESTTSSPQWHYNLIDGAITKWLCNTENRRLLEAHLTHENLTFTLKRELSFFVLTFHLFHLPASSIVNTAASSSVQFGPASPGDST